MRVRAFVLHLTRAAARRDNARTLLESCGCQGEIWPAVDGAAMRAADLAATVGAGLYAPAYPFGLKAGEIGCFLSHRQIWAELVRRGDDAALILEDDAGLDPGLFAGAAALAREHIADLGYIQFQTRPPRGPSALIDRAAGCTLIVPRRGGLRTTAQMVGRAAAAHLLALSEPFDRPVDAFVQSHWHTGLRPGVIHPSGVSEIAARLDGTTIQTGRKPLTEKLWRELRRARYRRAVDRYSRRSPAPAEGGLHG